METELPLNLRTFEDGNVVLFKRQNSKNWQARIRRYTGAWLDISTKEKDFEKAKKVACNKYKRIAWLQENDEIDISKKFKDVATLTKRQLQKELDTGGGKQVYIHYIQAIDNYLIPVFRDTLVHKINFEKIVELEEFRRNKIGREANKSTINTHNSALNKVFKTAIEQKFMLPIQIPPLRNHGEKSKSRPYFSKDEYSKLVRNLREWEKTGHQRKTREIRELLRDYVLIIANTGIRTGEEALSMRWKNIAPITGNRRIKKGVADDNGLEISVTGKTGTRAVIARNADDNVSNPLHRIQSRFDELKGLTDTELFKRNEYVFRLQDGELIKHERLAKNFNSLLKSIDLLVNTAGEQRSLYSLRHTYATFAIMDDLDMESLAVQMGTSIAMLERHYSKLKPYMRFGKLSGNDKKSQREAEETESEEMAMLRTMNEQLQKQLDTQNKLLAKLVEND